MEKAPEGIVGNYPEQQPEHDHMTPEHVDRRLPSPRAQPQQNLPPPIPYGTTTPPTPNRAGPRFLTKVNSDRLENGAAHGNAKIPSHVGGRHLSPPPHPDTETDGVEATGDGEEIEDEDDDMYMDDVNQDHVHPVATGTEPKTVPSVSSGGGPTAADIHHHDEHRHGITDKTLQNEHTRDVSDDTRGEANAHSGGGVMAHGSAEDVHEV
jgi:hypothetical protein